MKSSFFAWGELFAWSWSDSQGRSLRGTASGGAFDKVVLYKVGRKYWNSQSCKRASDGGNFCPPRGAARSSLVPRDLTAELCLIATRFARNFAVGNTPCGVLYYSLLGSFLALSFAVVFSIVGNLLAFLL